MSLRAPGVTWWACSVTDPKNRPELRLAAAIELARMRGIAADTIHVSPGAAAETRAPDGVTVVADEHVSVNQFRFPRGEAE